MVGFMHGLDHSKAGWFGGNKDGASIYENFIELLHIWDDLVDKDKSVPQEKINRAFFIALVELPANPLYSLIQKELIPLWVSTILAYQTANAFEASKDRHGLEISHTLRYAAGHIISYIINICVGPEKAKEILPEVWKSIVFERYDDYLKEHLGA